MASCAVPITLCAQAPALFEVVISIAKIKESTGLVKSSIYELKKSLINVGLIISKAAPSKMSFLRMHPGRATAAAGAAARRMAAAAKKWQQREQRQQQEEYVV